jgi:hypothetical protein
VDPAELAFSTVLAVLLLGLAGYFSWQQWRTLRELRANPEMPAEDRRFLRSQAVRRLFCSALMVVLALLLAGWYGLGMDAEFRELFREGRERWAAAEDQVLTEEQKDFYRFMATYWGAALLLLFAIIALAGIDAWAISRYGIRQRRRLRDERAQALLDLQAARRRHQGNGER